MIAGPPGAGKTMFSLVAAVKMGLLGVSSLYISADSDEDTMAARTAAAITKHPTHVVEETIRRGLFAEEYGPLVEALPLRFVFDPSEPSIEDIADAVTAWVEVWGRPPDMIWVDNLMNVKTEGGNEWQEMRQVCKDLHFLGRKSKSATVALHHTSEQESEHIDSAPPRKAIQGKVSQLPSLILTTASKGSEMFVAVVKNRHAPADPKAQEPLRLIADFTNCQIYDQRLSDELGWRTP